MTKIGRCHRCHRHRLNEKDGYNCNQLKKEAADEKVEGRC